MVSTDWPWLGRYITAHSLYFKWRRQICNISNIDAIWVLCIYILWWRYFGASSIHCPAVYYYVCKYTFVWEKSGIQQSAFFCKHFHLIKCMCSVLIYYSEWVSEWFNIVSATEAILPIYYVLVYYVLDQWSLTWGEFPPPPPVGIWPSLGGNGQLSKTIQKIGAYEAGTTISLKPMIFHCSLKSS